jgi:hypothetical protein
MFWYTCCMQHERFNPLPVTAEQEDLKTEQFESLALLQKADIEMYTDKVMSLRESMDRSQEGFPDEEAQALLEEVEQYLQIQRNTSPDRIDDSVHTLFSTLLEGPSAGMGEAMQKDPSWDALYTTWRKRVEDVVLMYIEENAEKIRPHLENYSADPTAFHCTLGYLPILLTSQAGLYEHQELVKLFSTLYPSAHDRLRAYRTLDQGEGGEGPDGDERAGLRDMYTCLCVTGDDGAIDDMASEYVDGTWLNDSFQMVADTLEAGLWKPLNADKVSRLSDAEREAMIGKHRENEARKPGVKMLNTILRSYDLDPEQHLDAWCQRESTDDNNVGTCCAHLETIRDIESKEEGGAWLLNKRFGIHNYGRYGKEILLEQVQRADDSEVPYGIILTASSDYNGAFVQSGWQRYEVNKSAQEQGLHTRIIEASSLTDLARRLITLEKIYGPERIEFAYVEGHGEPKSIQLGERPQDCITNETLGQASDRCPLFFKQGAPVMLYSCSTGSRKGVASALSAKLNTEVSAPTEPPYGIADLKLVRGKTGALRFEGEYKFTSEQNGATVRYRAGKQPVGDIARSAYEKVFGKPKK